MMERLTEILEFLTTHEADITVFPECILPLDCLPSLVEFSRGRVVIAGLDCVRNDADARKLLNIAENAADESDLLYRNVSVLIESERVHLVTKRSLSDLETAVEGSGPFVIDVMVRGRRIRLAVAVCMDYLRWEEEARSQAAEILCIPACSATIAPFPPDKPRDHVRLLANCAVYGGSQIMIPALRGGLVNSLGVEPISREYEAIIMVDYDRYPQQPTGLRRTENLLQLRAELVARGVENEMALEAIRALNTAPDPTHWTAIQPREHLKDCLSNIRSDSPLAESLSAYLGSLAVNIEDPNLMKLARTHLIVDPGGRDVIRFQQTDFAVERLKELPRLPGVPVGQAIDIYSELNAKLSGRLRVTDLDTSLPQESSGDACTETARPIDVNEEGNGRGNVREDGDNSAAIILFPDRLSAEHANSDEARSWRDLAEVLRQTSLDGEDWVTLAGSTRWLRSELDARRVQDSGLPESVPGLVAKLRDLLTTVANSSTSPARLDACAAEARWTREMLLRLLTPKSQ
jgi:hypothetical protein